MTALLPGASAHPLLPPSNFTGTYDEGSNTIHLSWGPPTEGGTPSAYNVYRNGLLLGTVTSLGYDDLHPVRSAVYAVTATESGSESLPSILFMDCGSQCDSGMPSLPMGRGVRLPPDMVETYCGLLGYEVRSTYPYFSWGIRYECLPVEP